MPYSVRLMFIGAMILPVVTGCRSQGKGGAFSESASPVAVYYLYDHRGDVTSLVDGDGKVLRDQSEYPYGEERAASADALPLYYSHTGKEYDAETGLVYFGGRYYAPSLGRWITPDPLYLDRKPEKLIEEPFELNLYSYVRNNPITFLDEDGYRLVLAADSTVDHQQQLAAARAYFVAHGKDDLWNKLDAHKETIYIHMVTGGKSQFDPRDPNHLRIDWDPRSGLCVAQGPEKDWQADSRGGIIQSPATGLYHEMGHAWRYLAGTYNPGPQEERAVLRDYEIPAAKAFDEPIRYRNQGSPIPVYDALSKTSSMRKPGGE